MLEKKSLRIFLKSAFLTALGIVLVLIGFFGAAFFAGKPILLG